jgi:hypothetical protein
LLDRCHLLPALGWYIAGIKDFLVGGVEGHGPVDKIFVMIEIKVRIVIKNGQIDSLGESHEEAVRNLVQDIQKSRILRVLLIL